jgi:hypothetical protein
MTIGLLHPSRGRAQKSYQTVMNWLAKAQETSNITVYLSLDWDDPQRQEYLDLYDERQFFDIGVSLMTQINNNKSVVDATNIAAIGADEDILIYLSDDFDCPENWDYLVSSYFYLKVNEESPMLLKVDDCLQKFEIPVLTIPMMNQALYKQLGYFWHPAYKSMFVDCDLYEVCKKLGVLKFAPELKFPHLHHSIGKCENDETYRASEANWVQGETIFKERRAKGFPIL